MEMKREVYTSHLQARRLWGVVGEPLVQKSAIQCHMGQSGSEQQVNTEGKVEYIRNFADLEFDLLIFKFQLDIEIV